MNEAKVQGPYTNKRGEHENDKGDGQIMMVTSQVGQQILRIIKQGS